MLTPATVTMKRPAFATLALLVAVASCAPERPVARSAADVEHALSTITAQEILRDISTLASDPFEGRAPGTRGEDSSVAFLQREFQRYGLAPGNPDGSFIQRVPLVGTTSK